MNNKLSHNPAAAQQDLHTRLNRLPIREALHGKTPYGAPQEDVPIRLNVNENTHPIEPQVLAEFEQAVKATLKGINRYPDRDFISLRQQLAAYLNQAVPTMPKPLDATNMWAANGSNEVLQHILQVFGGPGRTALSFHPTYTMYEMLANGTNTRYVSAPRGGPRHRLDTNTAKQAITTHQPNIIFLCSPNNPVGDRLTPTQIQEIYDHSAKNNTIIVVDEAYAEFSSHPEDSALRLLTDKTGNYRTRLIITRTMSKAFAIAGLRFGYMAAVPEMVAAMQLVRLPYHLSTATQAIAHTALKHAPTLLKDIKSITTQRERITTQLKNNGYNPYLSDANFVLFTGVKDPQHLWQHLKTAGILIRDIGLKHHLRVTAGTPQETNTFLKHITTYTQKQQANLAGEPA